METRIRDVADDIPKPMIPIGERPILWHIIWSYATHGLTDFVLCLGYKGWAIKRWFLDYRLATADVSFSTADPHRIEVHGHNPPDDWRVTFAETGPNAMTGCRVKRIEKYVTGDTFLLTYGDGVSDVDITDLLRYHREHGKLATVTAVQPPGRFGEIEVRGSRVIQFREKPGSAPGRISAGYFVFQREVFDWLDDDESRTLEQGPLAVLAEDGQLMSYPQDGFWHPMDNSRDYQHLNALWAAGQAAWAVHPSGTSRLAAA